MLTSKIKEYIECRKEKKEFKKSFEKQRKAKHHMQHAPIGYFENWLHPCNWYNNITQCFYSVKRAYQRIRYGVCEKDVWNLDGYIAEVIANGCRYLKNKCYSYPGYGDADTPEKWENELQRLITLAENYLKEPWYSPDYKFENDNCDTDKSKLHKIDKLEKENFEEYMATLKKWYRNLWD